MPALVIVPDTACVPAVVGVPTITVADAGAPANTTLVALADVSGTVDGLSADAFAHHAVTNVSEVAGISSAAG